MPRPVGTPFTFTDPKALCSIVVTDAPELERPNAVKIEINSAKGGWCIWGIRLPEGYDASKKVALSFWIRGEQGEERFEVGIKDKITYAGQEPKVAQTATMGWQQLSIPLQSFKGQNLASLDNFSLSFTFQDAPGSGTIYVDGFIFID